MSIEENKKLAAEFFARLSANDLAGALDTQHVFATWFEQ